jgi:uncharacterized tellurite resistance protein B-like protein
MLQALKDLFDQFVAPRPDADPTEMLQLASAVLLVEVMRADAVSTPAERAAVLAALREQFGIDAPAAAALVARAEDTARQASDTFAFTSRINESFDMPHRIALVESLWRVAYAEGELGADENHLLRKVADLLYVPQGAYINAKMRARDAVAGNSTAIVRPAPAAG